MRLEQNINEGTFGFQIAPMIDVVFVIMLFFMVMAGAVKVENELNTQLPGTASTSTRRPISKKLSYIRSVWDFQGDVGGGGNV